MKKYLAGQLDGNTEVYVASEAIETVRFWRADSAAAWDKCDEYREVLKRLQTAEQHECLGCGEPAPSPMTHCENCHGFHAEIAKSS